MSTLLDEVTKITANRSYRGFSDSIKRFFLSTEVQERVTEFKEEIGHLRANFHVQKRLSRARILPHNSWDLAWTLDLGMIDCRMILQR